MAVVLNDYTIGKGIVNFDSEVYRWNAHSFNPTSDPACGYQTWDIFDNPASDDWDTPPYSYIPETDFDLSGFCYGNEVVMFVLSWYITGESESGTVIIRYKDPDSNTIFTNSASWSGDAGEWYYRWAAIGVKAGGAEIWKNGTYSIEYDISWDGGASHETGTVYFTVSNYPTATSTSGYAGSIWVEDDYLCFASYSGYKIRCRHDGSSSYVGTEYAGAVWLETNGKISYVDASGYKRNTKLGDKYGYDGWTTELPSAPGASYAGSIWVSSASEGTTYLMIISADGIKYRIGAGYVESGDYQ
jgi:hypothetical protein